MYKILLTSLILLFFTTTAEARVCLPWAISEAIKANGGVSNYRILDWELSKGKAEGYYAEETFKKLGIKYKKVKEITKFPVIVEVKAHAYTITGELGKYWRVKDINCEDCLYLKSDVTKKHLFYYYIYAKN